MHSRDIQPHRTYFVACLGGRVWCVATAPGLAAFDTPTGVVWVDAFSVRP